MLLRMQPWILPVHYAASHPIVQLLQWLLFFVTFLTYFLLCCFAILVCYWSNVFIMPSSHSYDDSTLFHALPLLNLAKNISSHPKVLMTATCSPYFFYSRQKQIKFPLLSIYTKLYNFLVTTLPCITVSSQGGNSRCVHFTGLNPCL